MNLVLFQDFLLCISIISTHQRTRNCYFDYNENLKKNIWDLKKFMEYSASAVIFVSSNLCDEHLPRTKMSFFIINMK